MRRLLNGLGIAVGAGFGLAAGFYAVSLLDDGAASRGRFLALASLIPWVGPLAGAGIGALFGFVLSNLPFQKEDEETELREYLVSIKSNPEEKMRLKMQILEQGAAEGALGVEDSEELHILRRFFALEPDMRKIIRIAQLEIDQSLGNATVKDREVLESWLAVYEGTREAIEVRKVLILRDYKERGIASAKELDLLKALEAKFE